MVIRCFPTIFISRSAIAAGVPAAWWCRVHPSGVHTANSSRMTPIPCFVLCRLLDHELEFAAFIGPGNDMGQRIDIADAMDHIFGIVILNDWSARDVQKWEYQPLGPFNAKNFASTISPWVVTIDALAPYRRPGPNREAGDPAVLDYLTPASDDMLDVICEASIASSRCGRTVCPLNV